ncbi:hypothetical protein [Glutamicibacter sp.]|uniref:hypothetical protein n=1 Tax=Glutamicibacter sp. TaxID=1931995 RepID=UPI0028BDBCF6|nr:hypothetical protein [Glutamicibacter sp.]
MHKEKPDESKRSSINSEEQLKNTNENPLTEEDLLREQEAESFPASDPPANY